MDDQILGCQNLICSTDATDPSRPLAKTKVTRAFPYRKFNKLEGEIRFRGGECYQWYYS